jgi:Virulence-associated protein E-like domain
MSKRKGRKAKRNRREKAAQKWQLQKVTHGETPAQLQIICEDFITWPDSDRTGMPLHTSQTNVAEFLRHSNVRLGFNAFTLTPTVWNGDRWWRLDDAFLARLRMAMNRKYFQPPKEFLYDALFDIACANSYHPVLQYLDSLRWDSTPRLDGLLSTYFGAEDIELHRAFGRCQLMAAVAVATGGPALRTSDHPCCGQLSHPAVPRGSCLCGWF